MPRSGRVSSSPDMHHIRALQLSWQPAQGTTRYSKQRRWGTGFDRALQDFRFCQSAAAAQSWANLAATGPICE